MKVLIKSSYHVETKTMAGSFCTARKMRRVAPRMLGFHGLHLESLLHCALP
jgi:hypothetical protein